MPPHRIGLLALSSVFVLAGRPSASAQQTPPGGFPPINFSGVIYANYQYRTDPPFKDFNRFDLERAYLTFRMPAGNRGSVRVTTDVFQQQNVPNNAFYAGWVVRMKYAYFQYDYLKSATWNANARIGLLQTVIIDHEEQFFPRWISQVAIERAGYMSSADAGVATTFTMPHSWGEIYGTITNGPGYGNREGDRFKDFALRVSLTPLAREPDPLWRTFTISPWYLAGAIGSRIAGLTSGLARNRYGIFAGLRDPRLTAGAEFAGQLEGGESGTPATRVTADSTGHLYSGFIWAKPKAADSTSIFRKLGGLLRYDYVTPRNDAPESIPWPARYHVFIGALTWDINTRASMSLDYQEQLPNTPGVPTAPSKIFFAHFVANF